jgi:hypothetical protein
MHTGIISFCDRIAFNIKCSDAKDWILNVLEKKYQLRILQKHWFKLDDIQFKYIQTIPHWVCLRSNGNPYFLYFTKYEDVPQMMYIDKKVQPGYQKPRIILTKGQFTEDIFENTLIEGEMVKDKQGQWIFLINDVIIYKGKYLNNQPLSQRIGYAYEMLDKHYTPDDLMDVCQYQVKKYFECDQFNISKMLEFAKDIPYTNRGVYFMPQPMKYKPKLMNFNDELIKNVIRKVKDMPDFQERMVPTNTINKTENSATATHTHVPIVAATTEMNTNVNINKPIVPTTYTENDKMVWLRKTEQPDVYDLYENENSLQKMGIASVSSLMLSKMLRNIFKNLNVATSIPFKCNYDLNTNKWTPVQCLR